MGKQVPLESSVVATIIKKLNAVPGCRVKKFHGSAFGMMELDIYGCFNGRAVFIEVKRPGGKATERQKREIERWRAVGALTGCATTPQEALSIINQIRGEGSGLTGRRSSFRTSSTQSRALLRKQRPKHGWSKRKSGSRQRPKTSHRSVETF